MRKKNKNQGRKTMVGRLAGLKYLVNQNSWGLSCSNHCERPPWKHKAQCRLIFLLRSISQVLQIPEKPPPLTPSHGK